jgi:aspartate/methionine/tyrosine aminotransferase
MPLSLNAALLSLAPSGIRRFTALAQATPGCVSLALGEPSETTPPEVVSRAQSDLAAGMTHYAPNEGMLDVRRDICAYMKRSRGLTYDPKQEVVLTCGATEALFSTLMALIEPGDEVVIPQPAFGLYDSIVRLCRGIPVPLDTSRAQFQIRLEELRAATSPRTKAIVLTSPNNPTGCALGKQSLDTVANAACELGFFVVCDDVYTQLVYADDFSSFAERHKELRDRTIVVESFSKPYAMCGWRLGWFAADKPVAQQAAKVHQYALSCLPTFTQPAARIALGYNVAPMRASYRARRNLTLSALDAMDLPTVKPDGAFYAFPSIEGLGLSSEEFCLRAIQEQGVALVPGSIFGCEGYVRLSYACDMKTLEAGLTRLARFVEALR